MPTRKVDDVPPVCFDPDHDPPKFIVLQPGVYEHTCLSCGYKLRFVVNNPSL